MFYSTILSRSSLGYDCQCLARHYGPRLATCSNPTTTPIECSPVYFPLIAFWYRGQNA
jgi:hypothetical protein